MSLQGHDLLLSTRVPSYRDKGVDLGARLFTFLIAVQCWFCMVAGAAGLDHVTIGITKLPLAENERVYLANIEQRGLRLSMRAFPAISLAISNADPAKISRF